MNRLSLLSSRRLWPVVALSLFSGLGCSQGPESGGDSAPEAVGVSQEPLSASATAAFGFESLANWTISSGTATLGAPRTQGQLALRLAKPVNHTTLTSRPL